MTIPERAIVIDGRDGKTQDQVRAIAQAHFHITPVEEVVNRRGKHDGFYLRGDPLHYYHVMSIQYGMYVASLDPMMPSQTRPMVQAFLDMEKANKTQ